MGAVTGVVVGVQMMMLGLDEYLWRALDESRARPHYLVGERLNVEPPRTEGD